MISSVETEPIIGKIAAFRQEHPRVKFRIYEGNTYQLLDKLNTGIIEAAIVRSPFPEEPYDCFYLSGEIMMAVGERCFFPRPGADTISLKELCSCPLVVYRRWEGVLNRLFAPDSRIICASTTMPGPALHGRRQAAASRWCRPLSPGASGRTFS